ncbi:hypothetical protein M758_UG292700, partial [Ceratodon purpureus]
RPDAPPPQPTPQVSLLLICIFAFLRNKPISKLTQISKLKSRNFAPKNCSRNANQKRTNKIVYTSGGIRARNRRYKEGRGSSACDKTPVCSLPPKLLSSSFAWCFVPDRLSISSKETSEQEPSFYDSIHGSWIHLLICWLHQQRCCCLP